MPKLSYYIQTFILAGLTFSGIQYLGNSVNPLLGGILSGIPISIPSMLLINGIAKQKQFIFSANIMVASMCLATYLCWYLYVKQKWSNHHAVITSCGIWLVSAIIYYYFLIKK